MCAVKSTSTVDIEADGLVTIHTSEIRAAICNAKTKALEEAAEICDRRVKAWAKYVGRADEGCSLSLQEECEDVAHAIRALKDKP